MSDLRRRLPAGAGLLSPHRAKRERPTLLLNRDDRWRSGERPKRDGDHEGTAATDEVDRAVDTLDARVRIRAGTTIKDRLATPDGADDGQDEDGEGEPTHACHP
jgi:hypothetical protein